MPLYFSDALMRTDFSSSWWRPDRQPAVRRQVGLRPCIAINGPDLSYVADSYKEHFDWARQERVSLLVDSEHRKLQGSLDGDDHEHMRALSKWIDALRAKHGYDVRLGLWDRPPNHWMPHLRRRSNGDILTRSFAHFSRLVQANGRFSGRGLTDQQDKLNLALYVPRVWSDDKDHARWAKGVKRVFSEARADNKVVGAWVSQAYDGLEPRGLMSSDRMRACLEVVAEEEPESIDLWGGFERDPDERELPTWIDKVQELMKIKG